MDNKKIPHGIEALREMLIQFDEAGYEPTEPGHAVYGGSSGSDFKNALMVAINECICEEIIKFFCSLKEEFELEDFDGYFLEYLGTLNWLDKLKDLSYGSLQFKYVADGNNFQENPPADFAEKEKVIDQLLHDLYDITEGKDFCWCCVAEALYDAGWRKQELDNEQIEG